MKPARYGRVKWLSQTAYHEERGKNTPSGATWAPYATVTHAFVPVWLKFPGHYQTVNNLHYAR